MSATRLSAGDRLERLLSIVPWVVANDGPTLAEIAARFDYPEKNLLADLTDVLFMVGTYPYTPDQLVEVVVDDDRVWIHYAEYFSRPLRLAPQEALALVASSSGLLSVPGADPDGPLARGLAKLGASLGVRPGDDLEVDLGRAPVDLLARVRAAVAASARCEIDYYSYARDETTMRVVEPYRVTHNQGQWYLLAYCTAAEGERLFRFDRIRSFTQLDSTFEPPAEELHVSIFDPRPEDPRVTLLLDGSATWVAEAFPVDSVEPLDDGRQRVVLAVSATPWLERLLLRLGASAEVESQDPRLPPDLAASAAARVLARYQA